MDRGDGRCPQCRCPYRDRIDEPNMFETRYRCCHCGYMTIQTPELRMACAASVRDNSPLYTTMDECTPLTRDTMQYAVQKLRNNNNWFYTGDTKLVNMKKSIDKPSNEAEQYYLSRAFTKLQ